MATARKRVDCGLSDAGRGDTVDCPIRPASAPASTGAALAGGTLTIALPAKSVVILEL